MVLRADVVAGLVFVPLVDDKGTGLIASVADETLSPGKSSGFVVEGTRSRLLLRPLHINHLPRPATSHGTSMRDAKVLGCPKAPWAVDGTPMSTGRIRP